MKKYIFSPTDCKDTVITEVDLNTIFQDTEDAFKIQPNSYFKDYEFNEITYHVNIGNLRYHVMNKTRKCNCCGLYGTKMFLATFQEKNNSGYCFKFFAENKSPNDRESYLTLMTMDHIVAKKDGGTDDLNNLQCLCINCNQLKNIFEPVPLNKIKSCLFSAYRSYRSTISIQKTIKKNKQDYLLVEKLERLVENITLNLSKIEDTEKQKVIHQKMIDAQSQLVELKEKLKDQEIQAQIKGIV